MNERASGIAEEMTKARANTIAVFEGYWLLQKMQASTSINPLYDRIFDPINTPRESSVNLPARKTMEEYLLRVRDDVFSYLERVDFESDEPLLKDAFIFDL